MLLRTASHRGSVIVRGFHPAEDLSLPEGCPFQNTNGFQYAGARLFLSIFLGFQSTFRLKGCRQHGVSSLLALQTAAACSTFTSTANLLESTIYSAKIKSLLQYLASFRDPGGIRTHGLSLRSAKKRSPLMPFGTPGVPYFTGFLTFLSVRISLQNTPVFPG